MKIGVNSRLLQKGNGGIPHYIKCLYNELQQSDESNTYVFLQDDESIASGITSIFKFPLDSLRAFLFDNFFVNNLIKKEKIDVFHGPSCILPIFKIRGVRYVVTVHDLAFLKVPWMYGFFYKAYYFLALYVSLRAADIIVTDSISAKEDIMKFYGTNASKIRVVPLGVDEVFWNSPQEEKRFFEEKYFLSVATHPRRKNILGVLEAFSQSSLVQEYHYVVIGTIFDEKFRNELSVRINSLGLSERVHLLGYVEINDMVNLYRKASFLIYPCYYDGFSFPVLEAMASKCPVIASNTSTFPELVPDDHWLVDPYNVADIRCKMEEIVSLSEQDRAKMISTNLLFSQKFTWQNTTSGMKGIFDQLKFE